MVPGPWAHYGNRGFTRDQALLGGLFLGIVAVLAFVDPSLALQALLGV